MYSESFILTLNIFVVLCHIFEVLLIEWKPKKYHTDEQFLNLIENSQEETKSVAQKYMTSDPPDLIQALQ